MRPFSHYLKEIKSTSKTALYDLSGTTPPAPPKSWFRSVPVSFSETERNSAVELLKSSVAGRARFTKSGVHIYPGATQAVFQVVASLTEPGQTILLERPNYEPHVAAAKFLGLKVRYFSNGADAASMRAELQALKHHVHIVLLTSPHCVTGKVIDEKDLSHLNKLGVPVVVDEIYLPLFAKGRLTNCHFSSSSNLISIGGLSKSAGISTARIGWSISSPKYVPRFHQSGLHLHTDLSASSVEIANQTFEVWDRINSRLNRIVDANRSTVRLAALKHPTIFSHAFEFGYFGSLKIPQKFNSAADFVKYLGRKSLRVRSCEHFSAPDQIRFSMMMKPPEFKKAFGILMANYES